MVSPPKKTTQYVGLGECLFSKAQRKVLGLLFSTPDRRYYGNEIVAIANMGIGSILRELTKLVDAGLVLSTKEGKQRYYQANVDAPIFEELRSIVIKTFGVSDQIKEALSGMAQRIKLAFIYGSVAMGKDTAESDIDLMIVSDKLSYSKLMKNLLNLEATLGRPVNPTMYTVKELKDKLLN